MTETELAQLVKDLAKSTTPEPEPKTLAPELSEDRLRERYPALYADPKPSTPEDEEAARRYREGRERRRREEAWHWFFTSRGRRYTHCRLENFEVYDPSQEAALGALRDFEGRLDMDVKNGNGLVLFGPPGTGKDHLLAAMLRVAIIDAGFTASWVNGLDLFGRVRDRMDMDNASEESFIREHFGPDILAISDPLPPWGPLTSFQAQILYRVIDRRYSQCKPIWVTMNVAHAEEAADRLGAAVVDRLRERATAVYCDWPSYRTRDTNATHQEPR